MEKLDTDEEEFIYVSPKAIIKRRRRPSVLSSRKYFRKSKKQDRVEFTIPNNSISIIEISSTDSDSFKSSNSCSEIEESDLQVSKISSLKDLSVSEEIISPSPNKNDKNLKCLSTGKKRTYNKNLKQDVETEKRISNEKKLHGENPNTFLEVSILDYDTFQKPTNILDTLMNSTMIQPEIKPNKVKTDVKDNSNASEEAVHKSCENLLDALYGDSWRPYKEKVLPSSEKKAPRKKVLVEKQVPATERKAKKSEIYKNPYTDTEKHKSNNLLKALHTKRIREAIETPLIQNLKTLCDDDNIEKPSKIKLNFDENEESHKDEKMNNTREIYDNNFLCSDKENSIEKLSLKDRILRKKQTKEKNVKRLYKEQDEKNTGKNKEELLSDENINDILTAKMSTFGLGLNNTDKKQQNQKLNGEEAEKDKNIRNDLESSLNDNNSDGNIGMNVERRERKKTNLKKYFDSDSNDEIEINTKIAVPKETAFSTDNFKNIVREITQELQKTEINSNECNENPNLKKSRPKNIKKRAKVKTKNNFRDNSSDSDDSTIEYKNKLDIKKKTDDIKTYSFLASLSSNVPNHQCDPSAKIFKANFKNNKETLAKKLFDLYNEKVFGNLLPKNVPLEWNPRLVSTAGYCSSKKVTHTNGKVDMLASIVLSTKVLTTPDRLRDTMIHELCHAATWLIDKVRESHGKYWKAWVSKARKAFPELPPIKTCHNYELSSKYVYKCMDCGYEIKRHRKSLDIERKRCGYCSGKFQIFMNKVNKKGENKMTPLLDTPKKQPKGFAAFYQENYANYKTPRNTPAQVMKLLSNKFKELKVQ